jgi:predicted nucleic acid-binding protein
MNIKVVGTLGLLLQGYRDDYVPDLKAAIARMRDRGTWVTNEVIEAVLSAADRR